MGLFSLISLKDATLFSGTVRDNLDPFRASRST